MDVHPYDNGGVLHPNVVYTATELYESWRKDAEAIDRVIQEDLALAYAHEMEQ